MLYDICTQKIQFILNMTKCNRCNNKVERDDLKSSCQRCCGQFHASCVNLKKQDIDLLQKGKHWMCDSCRKITARRDSSSSLSQLDVISAQITELKLSIVEQNKMHEKNSALLETRVTKIEEALLKIESLKSENRVLREKISMLEANMDDLEQNSKNSSIEIHGVPEIDEPVTETVTKIFKDGLGIQYDENSINHCFRFKTKSKTNNVTNYGIVVKFSKQHIKDEIIGKKSKNKNLLTTKLFNASQTKPTPIYINECLTNTRKQLLNAAKLFQKDNGYKYVWTRNGKIMLKKSDDDKTVVIRNKQNLENLTLKNSNSLINKKC